MSFNIFEASFKGLTRDIENWLGSFEARHQAVDLNLLLDADNGKSALHYAAENGQLETVRLLIQKGMNPNITNSKNLSTPLHNAAFYGHSNIIEALLEAKADPYALNANKITPLHAGKRSRETFPLDPDRVPQFSKIIHSYNYNDYSVIIHPTR